MNPEMQQAIELFRTSVLEMAKTFNDTSHTIVESFTQERLDARRMFRELTASTDQRLLDLATSSEQRLDRANHMVDNLSKLEQVIAHEYTAHIQKLRADVDQSKKLIIEQQEYIRILQDKVDERDNHIRDLLAQIATQNHTISILADKALTAQPLMYNNMAPHQ